MQKYKVKVHETNLSEMQNKLSLVRWKTKTKISEDMYLISYCL